VQCSAANNTIKDLVFGLVRLAVLTESREVYLNLDHSWMERMLLPGARVAVTLVRRQRLAAFQYDPSHIPLLSSDQGDELETFHVVVSLSPTYLTDASGRRHAPAGTGTGAGRMGAEDEAEAVDGFLLRNPCFLPLKDPPLAHDVPSSPSLLRGVRHDAGAAVLVRLPERPYNGTCKFYERVTQQQHPDRCPSSSDASQLQVFPLTGIGWASHVMHMLHHLTFALKHGRVFLTPRAVESGAPFLFRRKQTQEEAFVTHTWAAWVGSDECPSERYAYDPWACHFISMSRCHTARLHYANKSEVDADARPPASATYAADLEDILRHRDAADGRQIGTWQWEYARLEQFIHRPNVQLRARIRHALRNLTPMRNTGSGSSSSGGGSRGVVGSSGIGGATPPLLGRCVAMHVRHGDSLVDERGSLPVDRSLHAHVACAAGLSAALGVDTIYLATDNVTLFATADVLYPQYRWYHQRRALKVYTGKAYDHVSERSKQQEVANLLADAILVSRCAAFEAVSDSGLSKVPPTLSSPCLAPI